MSKDLIVLTATIALCLGSLFFVVGLGKVLGVRPEHRKRSILSF